MAPVPTYFRTWCVKCKSYELHRVNTTLNTALDNKKDMYPYQCLECECDYKQTLFADIPEEEILAQRQRYKDVRRKQWSEWLKTGGYGYNMFDQLFSEEFPTKVIEDDAGQKAIDQVIKEERNKRLEAERLIRAENAAEVLKYINSRRNSKCVCGSGKKYKKCCQVRIENLKAKYSW